MPITQIFTGHALDLCDIVAISDVIEETKYHKIGTPDRVRTLFIEIYLAKSAPIKHKWASQELFNSTVFHHDQASWDQYSRMLQDKRKELLQQWSAATGKPLEVRE